MSTGEIPTLGSFATSTNYHDGFFIDPCVTNLPFLQDIPETGETGSPCVAFNPTASASAVLELQACHHTQMDESSNASSDKTFLYLLPSTFVLS